MKKSVFTLSMLTGLILAAGAAHAAAPTAVLKVTGELTVPTCEVSAVDDGVYNIGSISSTMVKATGSTSLTAMTKSWTVTCDAETYLNFTPVDNRAASVSVTGQASNFGLGTVNSTGKIGYFNAQVKNATVDGAASSLFGSSTATFTPAAAVYMATNAKLGWATSAANTQKSGKVFTADITVMPYLANSVVMNGPITDATDIDGSVTLNFAYGI